MSAGYVDGGAKIYKYIEKVLETLRTWGGDKLPSEMKSRVVREYDLRLVENHMKLLKKEREQRVKDKESLFH